MGVAVDIINQISEYNTSILRDHILKQNDNDEVSLSLSIPLSVYPSLSLPSLCLSLFLCIDGDPFPFCLGFTFFKYHYWSLS